MKKNGFLILLIVLFSGTAFSLTNKEIFDTGVSLFKQGQYQAAVDRFTQLIENAPGNADAYKNRGVSYMKLEKFDLAIQDFEKAKSIFPELQGLYSNLGVAWYYKKEYEKAIENYDMEIRLAPENAVAFFNRALSLAELNQNDRALADLNRTIQLNPDFYWAISYKADLLAEKGDYASAIETYEAAVKKDPENAYARDKLSALKKRVAKNESIRSGEPVKKEAIVKDSTSQVQVYALQAGAFQNPDNARRLKEKIEKNGFDSRVLVLVDKKKRTWHIVRSGNFSTMAEAKKARTLLKEKTKIDSVVRPKGRW